MLCIHPTLHAQFLNRKVTLSAGTYNIGKVLNELEAQGGFTFSYQSKLVSGHKKIIVQQATKPVEEWLNYLFNQRLRFKETSTHIVLYTLAEGANYYLSGYVKDGKTGDAVSNAIVFDTEMLASALSDDNGYYRLSLKNSGKRAQAHIRISHQDYVEQNVILQPGYDQQQEVILFPNWEVTLDSIEVFAANRFERTNLGKLLVGTRQLMYAVSVKDFLSQQYVQFSVFPGVGTYGHMSAAAKNRFSFNLLGGYTGALHGFELGTVFNIVKSDAQFLQIAGALNYVEKEFQGVQISSAYNQVRELNGVQITGGMNLINEKGAGVMISGGINYVHEKFSGVQIAGLSNVTFRESHTKGVQVAGFNNLANEHFKGVQIAGAINYARSGRGWQIGLINKAQSWHGFQLGLINIADSLYGAGFGLINIQRKGIHRLALSTNEILPAQIFLQTGTKNLYTILQAGMRFQANDKVYMAGVGLGTEFKMAKNLWWQTDCTYNQFYVGSFAKMPAVVRVQPMLRYQFKHFFLATGPAFNAGTQLNYTSSPGYAPDLVKTSKHLYAQWQGWWGWQMALGIQ